MWCKRGLFHTPVEGIINRYTPSLYSCMGVGQLLCPQLTTHDSEAPSTHKGGGGHLQPHKGGGGGFKISHPAQRETVIVFYKVLPGVHMPSKAQVWLSSQPQQYPLQPHASKLHTAHVHVHDCRGCAVLLCFVVCLTLLASFFLPSLISH